LRLRGALVTGRIDLENITSDLAVELTDCLLPDGLSVRDATLPALVLEGCLIEQPEGSADPPLDASRLTAVLVGLTGSIIKASSDGGAVRLVGAHIGGQLECGGARMDNDSGPALRAEGLRVTQSVFLRSGFRATGTGHDGAVRLLGAHIGGQLNCSGGRMDNDSGPALYADQLSVERGMFLGDGFHATGTGDSGTVRLSGARIGGQLNCGGGRMDNDSGPALDGDRLRVEQGLLLAEGFEATGAGHDGAVRLLGGHIGGELDCGGANLHNASGPALSADQLRVEGGAFLCAGFQATGVGDDGAVRLVGAHIGGPLDCGGAQLRNDEGPALRGDGVHVEQDITLRDGFRATGTGYDGAVRLVGAHIGGDLYCGGARLQNASGPALDADGLRVEQDIALRDGFQATGGGRAVLALPGAQVGGAFWLDTTEVTRAQADGGALVDLDGLTYPRLPKPRGPVSQWLTLLREHTPGYAAQPYQQLAAVYHAAGHDSEARDILVAQRRDQIRRGDLNRRDRVWARFSGATLGFGYQPWRALLLLLAVLTASIAIAVAAGNSAGLAHTDRSPTPGAACTTIEQIGVGLDLGLPLIKTGTRDLCAPTNNATGQAVTITGWLLQLLAWGLATLFIAGFTSAVRKA
jgi:hypothetical protein